jgi:HEAT repeat protein
MPRKNSKRVTSVTTEKHFTTVPVKAKFAEVAKAAPVAAIVAPVAPAPAVDIKSLTKALHDIDADVAREAATALGTSGNAAAVEPLIEVVRNSNGYFHSVVRSAAAASLGQLKDRRAIEALLHAVHDPITDPSTEAIRALTALADPRAIAALVEVVRNTNGFFAGSVRRAAVLGLAKLGGETAIAELKRVAAADQEDTVIRQEAATAVAGK